MKRLIILALAILLSLPMVAGAQTNLSANLAWNPPTTIPTGMSIVSENVLWDVQSDSATGKYPNSVNTGAPVSSFTVTGLPAGAATYCFNVQIVDSIGAVSVVDGEACGFAITASASANGTISNPGTTIWGSNTAVTYTATPNTGYVVSSLVVNGVATTPANSYTFPALASNKTIAFTFAPPTAAVPPATGVKIVPPGS